MPETTLRDARRRGRARTSRCPRARGRGRASSSCTSSSASTPTSARRPTASPRAATSRSRPTCSRSAGRRRVCVLAAFRALAKRSGPAFDGDRGRPRGARRSARDATGRVGVIGFCMGGGFALLAAPSRRVRGGVGELRRRAAATPRDAPARRVPGRRHLRRAATACCRGARSEARGGARGQRGRARRRRSTRRVALAAQRHDGRCPTVDRVTGIGRHEPSAPDALRRIDAFFDRHVAGRGD